MDGHEIVEVNLSAVERTKRIDAEFYKDLISPLHLAMTSKSQKTERRKKKLLKSNFKVLNTIKHKLRNQIYEIRASKKCSFRK